MAISSFVDNEPILFPLVSGKSRTLTVCCAYIVADISVYVYIACGSDSGVGSSVGSGSAISVGSVSGSVVVSSLGSSFTSGVGSAVFSNVAVASYACSVMLSSVVVAVAVSVVACGISSCLFPQPTKRAVDKVIVARMVSNLLCIVPSCCFALLIDNINGYIVLKNCLILYYLDRNMQKRFWRHQF